MTSNRKLKYVLTIAGSDPSCGAGIQMDLAVFRHLGLHGLSVTTAETIQNTRGVYGLTCIPGQQVREAVKRLLEDFELSAIKIGMLGDGEIVLCLSELLKGMNTPIVFDPVLKSSNGYLLLDYKGIEFMKNHLMPLVELFCPNIPELVALTGMNIKSERDIDRAAKRLLDAGAKNILVKGGHRQDDSADILYKEGEKTVFPFERLEGYDVHGTGCTMSSLIAGQMALGFDLKESIRFAQQVIQQKIKDAVKIGKGERFYLRF